MNAHTLSSPRQEWFDSDYFPNGTHVAIKNLQGKVIGGSWETPVWPGSIPTAPPVSVTQGSYRPPSINSAGTHSAATYVNLKVDSKGRREPPRVGEMFYHNGKPMGIVTSAEVRHDGFGTQFNLTLMSQGQFNAAYKNP